MYNRVITVFGERKTMMFDIGSRVEMLNDFSNIPVSMLVHKTKKTRDKKTKDKKKHVNTSRTLGWLKDKNWKRHT